MISTSTPNYNFTGLSLGIAIDRTVIMFLRAFKVSVLLTRLSITSKTPDVDQS